MLIENVEKHIAKIKAEKEIAKLYGESQIGDNKGVKGQYTLSKMGKIWIGYSHDTEELNNNILTITQFEEWVGEQAKIFEDELLSLIIDMVNILKEE